MKLISLREVNSQVILYLKFIFLGVASLNFYFAIFGSDANLVFIYLLAAIFSAYLYYECSHYIKMTDTFGLLAPPLLASIIFFFLSIILPTTISYYYPLILFRYTDVYINSSSLICWAILLAMLSAFFMWRGFYFGRSRAKKINQHFLKKGTIRQSWTPNMNYLYVIEFIYISLSFLAIELGVFGLTASSETRQANSEVIEYLHIASSAGSLSLFLILTNYFYMKNNGVKSNKLKFICLALFVIHLLFGSISGFKSELVFPFILLGFSYFIAYRKIKISIIALTFISLIFSYLVVQPFREYMSSADLVGSKPSYSELARGVLKSSSDDFYVIVSDEPIYIQMVERFDLTQMTAIGVNGANIDIVNTAMIKDMFKSILLSPILAYIPRIFWSSKPSFGTGGWFNQIILGNYWDETTSVGMGPIAYFYFMGGFLAVIVGFIGIGYIQSLIFNGVARMGAGGLIIYLSVVNLLVTLPTEIGPSFIQILRMLPIAYILQKIIFMKKNYIL